LLAVSIGRSGTW